MYKQTCWRYINMTYTYANLEARLCCLFSLWLLLHEHMKFWWHGLSGIIKKICVQILFYLFSIIFLEKKFFGWVQKTILDKFILLFIIIYLNYIYLIKNISSEKVNQVRRGKNTIFKSAYEYFAELWWTLIFTDIVTSTFTLHVIFWETWDKNKIIFCIVPWDERVQIL